MPYLSKDLRNQLSRTTLVARDTAEKAVRAALENLAVHEKEARQHMSPEQRDLRNRLRARGRAAGDEREASVAQSWSPGVGGATNILVYASLPNAVWPYLSSKTRPR